MAILVEKAEGETCDRCRSVRQDVGSDENYQHFVAVVHTLLKKIIQKRLLKDSNKQKKIR